jgi:hypothetical protein
MVHGGKDYVPDDHPDRPQRGFHESTAMHRLLLGGNQSGKSLAAAHEIDWWARGTHPFREVPEKAVIWVISASYATIEGGIYRHLKDIIPDWEIEKKGNMIPATSIRRYWKLFNGSVIRFISGTGATSARRKVQSDEVDLIAIDEEIEDQIFDELQRRRLSRGGYGIYSLTAVESVEWVLDLEKRYNEGRSDVDLFRLKTTRAAEVGHVDKDVLTDLMENSSEESNRVRVEGETLQRQGLIYPEFNPVDHICQPFDIPDAWPKYMALDPGTNVFAGLWIAISPDDKAWAYREMYEHAASIEAIADFIYKAEGWVPNPHYDPSVTDSYFGRWMFKNKKTEQIVHRWVDPAEFGHNPGGGWKMGNLLADRFDLHCAPADNGVEVGIESVKLSLMMRFDETPRFQVFSTCTNFLKERSSYRRRGAITFGRERDERSTRPVKKKDHVMDCWRYLMRGGFTAHGEGFSAHEYQENVIGQAALRVGPDGSVANARERESFLKMERELASGPAPVSNDFGLGVEW